jgi:hypothetical protein
MSARALGLEPQMTSSYADVDLGKMLVAVRMLAKVPASRIARAMPTQGAELRRAS